jgi:hypothetical protein
MADFDPTTAVPVEDTTETQGQFDPSTATPTFSGANLTNRDIVHNSLVNMGLPQKMQAGFLGDIDQESSFNPAEVDDLNTRDPSFGLFQTGSKLYSQYVQKMAAQGIMPGDPRFTYGQAPFVLEHFKQANPQRWQAMENADSPAEVVRIFRGTKDWGYGIAGARYEKANAYQKMISGMSDVEVAPGVPAELKRALPVAPPAQQQPQFDPTTAVPVEEPPTQQAQQFDPSTAVPVEETPKELTKEQLIEGIRQFQTAVQMNPIFSAGAYQFPKKPLEELTKEQLLDNFRQTQAAVEGNPIFSAGQYQFAPPPQIAGGQQSREAMRAAAGQTAAIPSMSDILETISQTGRDIFGPALEAMRSTSEAFRMPELSEEQVAQLPPVLQTSARLGSLPAQFYNFAISPEGVATAAAFEAGGPLWRALLSAGFTTQAAQGAIESAKAGDWSQVPAQIATAVLTSFGARPSIPAPEFRPPPVRDMTMQEVSSAIDQIQKDNPHLSDAEAFAKFVQEQRAAQPLMPTIPRPQPIEAAGIGAAPPEALPEMGTQAEEVRRGHVAGVANEEGVASPILDQIDHPGFDPQERQILQDAKENGVIKIYRAVVKGQPIRDGDHIVLQRKDAVPYVDRSNMTIVEQEVPVEDVKFVQNPGAWPIRYEPEGGKFSQMRAEVPAEEAAPPTPTGVVDILRQKADEARQRIRARTLEGRVMTGVDPSNISDEATVMAYHIARGARTVADAAKPMIDEFGAQIRPALPKLFAQGSAIHEQNAVDAAWGLAGKYLNQDEKNTVGQNFVGNVTDIFSQLDPKLMMRDALEGKFLKGWYQQLGAFLSDLAGTDTTRLAHVIGTFGANTPPLENFVRGLDVYSRWLEQGRPQDIPSIDKILEDAVLTPEGRAAGKTAADMMAWRNNVREALSAQDPSTIQLSGPKVQPYARSFLGELDRGVLDRHMGIPYAMQLGLKGPEFEAALKQGSQIFGTRTRTLPSGRKVGIAGFPGLAFDARQRQAAEMATRQTGEPWRTGNIQETVWGKYQPLKILANAMKVGVDKLASGEIPYSKEKLSELQQEILPKKLIEHPEVQKQAERFQAAKAAEGGFQPGPKGGQAEAQSAPQRIRAAAQARKVARRAQGRQLGSLIGADPGDVADDVIIGASYIAEGLREPAKWGAAMVKEFGEDIRPRLADLYQRSLAMHDNMARVNPAFTTPRGQADADRAANAAQDAAHEASIQIEQNQAPSGVEPPLLGGPGAAGSVEQFNTASQIKQLTATVTSALNTPRPLNPLTRIQRAVNAVAGKVVSGWQGLANGMGRLRAIWQTGKNNYIRPWLPQTDFFRAIKEWGLADNKASFEARAFIQKLSKAVRDPLVREAITNYIEADGDQNLLAQRAAASGIQDRPGYEAAQRLTNDQRAFADNVRQYFDAMINEGIKAGILDHAVNNYITHLWKRPNKVTQALQADLQTGRLQTNFKYARKRIFDSFFEGEQAGYRPLSKDVGALIATYDLAFNRSVAARAMIKSLRDAVADDGKKVAMLSGMTQPVPAGQMPPEAYLIRSRFRPKDAVTADGRSYEVVNHPALRGWKFVIQDGLKPPSFYQADMLIHPDHAQFLRNVLTGSAWREGKLKAVVGPIFKTAALAKQTRLSLSLFHLDQEGLHSLFHRVNPANLEQINFDDPAQSALVRGGLVVSDYNAMELFAEGLRGGGLVSHIPVLGKMQTNFNEWLFKDYIPRLKMTMGLDAYARNLKRYPKLSPDIVAELTARQANAAFGELNYKLMGRSATVQDSLRLAVLAPDFLEARTQFIGQALRPYGREQFVALMLGAAAMYVTARALNQMLDNDPHWDKPFSVVSNGREYRLRTVMGDAYELVSDPRRFFYNRFSPWLKTGVTAITGRDWRGIKLTGWEQMKDFLSWFVPIPVGGSGQPATPAQRIAGSLGISNKPAETPIDLTYKAALKYKEGLKDPKIQQEVRRAQQETYAQGDYARLNRAILEKDSEQATTELVHLIKDLGKTPKDLIHYYAHLPMRPFTGSRTLENQWIAQMSPPEFTRYQNAVKQRYDMAQAASALIPNALAQARK